VSVSLRIAQNIEKANQSTKTQAISNAIGSIHFVKLPSE